MPADSYVFSGLWAIAMLVVFIQATRLSYRIEARSPQLKNTSGLPRKAMLFHTVINRGVARDAETQGLRRTMNRLLLADLAGFALVGGWLALRSP